MREGLDVILPARDSMMGEKKQSWDGEGRGGVTHASVISDQFLMTDCDILHRQKNHR